MPRSKNLGSYPDAFQELVRQAATRRIEIPLESEADARKLMGRLYAFHGALKKAISMKVGGATFAIATSQEDLASLQRMSEKVQYRVEGKILVARPQDMDPMARIINQALGGQTSQPVDAESIRPSAAFLEELQKPQNE